MVGELLHPSDDGRPPQIAHLVVFARGERERDRQKLCICFPVCVVMVRTVAISAQVYTEYMFPGAVERKVRVEKGVVFGGWGKKEN